MRILPEEKIKALLKLMNSTTNGKLPDHEIVLQCFELAMDEKMLDYLLAVGTELHIVEELEALYHSQQLITVQVYCTLLLHKCP